MTKAIVLGAGMVGSVMAGDLAEDPDFDVTIADLRPEALAKAAARASGRVHTREADLSDPATVERTVEAFDIVLGALSSSIGFQALRSVIEAGKNYCDICFMPEDALDLNDLAQATGVTAVVDCGVAPGLSNMIAGYAASELDECEQIDIYVGGLPRDPHPPFHYKAAFSPADVLEEYTRPARLLEHSKIVVREALSEPEPIDFPGLGTLEAFNTDGLRSLIQTLNVPFMKEKTVRYPGHADVMWAFREAGLLSRDPVSIGHITVRPLDVTSAVLFPKWTYDEGEEDLTVMRVIAKGLKDGAATRWTWELFDSYDRATHTTSMSRTTAFPCAIVARLIAAGKINQPGVVPPELIGQRPTMLDHVLGQLQRRGIKLDARRDPL